MDVVEAWKVYKEKLAQEVTQDERKEEQELVKEVK